MTIITDELTGDVTDAVLTAPDATQKPNNSNFNRLWIGQTISAFGSQVTELALPLTAVLYLGASASQVGLMSGLREIAFIGPLLFIGVLVDRIRRRPLMVGVDLGRAVVLGVVPILAVTHLLSMPVLYVIAIAMSCLTVTFDLAYRAYLPSIVTEDQLAAGNGKLQASDSLSGIAGPTLSGLLIQVVRAPFALAADAVSFLLSAVSLLSVTAVEPTAPKVDDRSVRGVFSDIRAGLRVTVNNRVMRSLAGLSATFNVFSGMMLTLIVLFATRTLGLSPAMLGGVLAAFGVGGLLGAITLFKVVDKVGYGRTLLCAYSIAVASIVAIPFVHGSPWVAAVLLGVIHLVAGFGIVAANIAEMTMRQLIVPSEGLGRVNASFRFIIGGLLPVAAIVAGLLGDHLGLRNTLYITSAGIPFSLLWIIFSPLASYKTPQDVEKVVV